MYVSRTARANTQLTVPMPTRAVVSEDREVASPFAIDASGTVKQFQSHRERLHSRLLSLLLTAPGERRMRPTYGTNIRNLLFQGMDAASLQTMLVTDLGLRQQINTYAPEINVLSITVDTFDFENGTVRLYFMIGGNGPDLSVYRSEVTLG